MTNPDPNPFADCDFIVCCGNAKPEDKHLASTIRCVGPPPGASFFATGHFSAAPSSKNAR
jgi:hypothetical protein